MVLEFQVFLKDVAGVQLHVLGSYAADHSAGFTQWAPLRAEISHSGRVLNVAAHHHSHYLPDHPHIGPWSTSGGTPERTRLPCRRPGLGRSERTRQHEPPDAV